jgi:hypothetical protein
MAEGETRQYELWYQVVEPTESLTQGDLILDCPLVGWGTEKLQFEGSGEIETLESAVISFKEDVIVMTQACDIEQDKVKNIVLCPCIPLSQFRREWEADMRRRNQNPSDKAWKKFCEKVADGFIWSITILNSYEGGSVATEHRIVDFHEVFTVPREFLQSYLNQQGQQRLRLLPPYREHLSQAFARFFMRVGLPTPVAPIQERTS